MTGGNWFAACQSRGGRYLARAMDTADWAEFNCEQLAPLVMRLRLKMEGATCEIVFVAKDCRDPVTFHASPNRLRLRSRKLHLSESGQALRWPGEQATGEYCDPDSRRQDYAGGTKPAAARRGHAD